MPQAKPFHDVLEVIDQLSADEQEELVDIPQHRLAKQGRARLLREIGEARSEQAASATRPATPGDLLREILT